MKERNKLILDEILRLYIKTGNPVSSRMIAKSQDISLSPASIRNIMADLEESGYVHQPHTSAGRIPTKEALKIYASHIIHEKNKNKTFQGTNLFPTFSDYDDMIEYISTSLSEQTGQSSFVIFPKEKKQYNTTKLFLGSFSNLLKQPEFESVEKIKKIFTVFEKKEHLLKKFNNLGKGLHVHIGEDNQISGLEDCALVSSSYEGFPAHGFIGIIGPTRMNYSEVIEAVRSTAHTLTKKMGNHYV
ncbi:MAG: hypothetical protein HYW47_02820 [Deltaproteobacteria bacterium]|nr:hypothetical protein [Deltaproteobacteria bacterium]